MRILITSNYRVGNETGSSHVTDLLAKSLSLKNHVCYLCLGAKFAIKNSTTHFRIITIPSIEINGISIPLITPKVVLDIESAITKFSPDIVHTQNSAFISKIAQIWANQKDIPIVTTFHHIPTQAIRHLLPKLPKNIFTKIIEDLYVQTSLKSFLQNINGVIALNEFQKKDILKVDKKIKIEVINNGLDLTNFINLKTKTSLKNEIKFIFMGSYIERKNQEFLIKVFKNLPMNFRLSCYGNINSGKAYYEKINLERPKNVELLDFTKKISETLNKYDFFISASIKEVQSLSIIYALSAGLPVIGLENETINELINSTNGLKFKKGTFPKKFALELQNFIKNSDYKKLSQKAKKDSEKFNIKKVLPKIEKFYDEVVQNKRIIKLGN